jgi:hypothetical protein
MVQDILVDKTYSKNYKLDIKKESGPPPISPWSVFSVYKGKELIAEYSIQNSVKIWIDQDQFINILVEINDADEWPNGKLEYYFHLTDTNEETILEESGTFNVINGKDSVKRVARPWDLLNPNTEYANSKVAKERFDICKSCPKLIKKIKVCEECGCFMALKTKLLHAECPIGKW